MYKSQTKESVASNYSNLCDDQSRPRSTFGGEQYGLLRSQSQVSYSSLYVLPRVEALPQPWKASVQALLFEYLVYSSVFSSDQTLFNAAVFKLLKFEYLQNLVYLEMAVWKSSCLLAMPLGTDYLAAQQWRKNEWKGVKREHRKSNAATIIIFHVMPFLGPPG